MVAQSYKRYKNIILVFWKPPTCRWVKINTYGSLCASKVFCGGISRNHRGAFMVCFSSSQGDVPVFQAELTCLVRLLFFWYWMFPRNIWKRLKSPAVVNYSRFSSYKPAVVNYRWGQKSHLHMFLGSFVCQKNNFRLIIAIEFAATHAWGRLWQESDSTSIVEAFKNYDVILYRLWNRWHNCHHLGLNSIFSQIFREENYYADKLTNHSHSIYDTIWFDSIPQFFLEDFSWDQQIT